MHPAHTHTHSPFVCLNELMNLSCRLHSFYYVQCSVFGVQCAASFEICTPFIQREKKRKRNGTCYAPFYSFYLAFSWMHKSKVNLNTWHRCTWTSILNVWIIRLSYSLFYYFLIPVTCPLHAFPVSVIHFSYNNYHNDGHFNSNTLQFS